MGFLLLLVIIALTIVLIRSADMTVVSIRKLVHGSGAIGISAIIIAIGTSFPELFVGVTSAVEGSSGLSLGVALGSNIANIALIGAGAALISGRVHISELIINKIVWVSFICGLLPYILMLDGNLNRIDGVILIFVYISYVLSFFGNLNVRAIEEVQKNINFSKLIKRVEHFAENKWKSLAGIFIGISLMLFSADTIVKFSGVLAEKVNIPVFVIGLFILAIGTSLPEFAFSLESLKDKEPEMFVGNLLGSIVANTTLVIGLSALINPVSSIDYLKYFTPAMAFILVYLLFYLFVRTKKRLDRWEAAVLVAIYFIFFLVELI